MKLKYCLQDRPPTCLHILGQPLVNACWEEAKELREQLRKIQEQFDLNKDPQFYFLEQERIMELLDEVLNYNAK